MDPEVGAIATPEFEEAASAFVAPNQFQTLLGVWVGPERDTVVICFY